MNPDTPENRVYIQRNRLWLLGEVVVKKLIREKPDDAIGAILSVFEAEQSKPTDTIEPPTPEDAAEAREYLQKQNIAVIVEAWMQATLETKPENPLEFSIAHFKKLTGNDSVAGSSTTGAENPDENLADAL